MTAFFHFQLDPTVDLVTADWDPFTHTKWMQPLLVELSSWRSTLKQIRNANFEINNATEIVFVADFPGLSLENYVAAEIKANVTVLKGITIFVKNSCNILQSCNKISTRGSKLTIRT